MRDKQMSSNEVSRSLSSSEKKMRLSIVRRVQVWQSEREREQLVGGKLDAFVICIGWRVCMRVSACLIAFVYGHYFILFIYLFICFFFFLILFWCLSRWLRIVGFICAWFVCNRYCLTISLIRGGHLFATFTLSSSSSPLCVFFFRLYIFDSLLFNWHTIGIWIALCVYDLIEHLTD